MKADDKDERGNGLPIAAGSRELVENALPKLIALMEGLEVEQIDRFLKTAGIAEYRKLGQLIVIEVKKRIYRTYANAESSG